MAAAKSDVHALLDIPPSCRLPRGVDVLDVAEACRQYALEMVSCPPRSTRDLDAWLDGPYRSVVTVIEPAPARLPARHDAVIEMPVFARAQVLSVLRGMTRTPPDVAFTTAAIHDGFVERCCDASGRLGFVPVDRPNMRLTERVLSLVAVDYFARPREWLDGRLFGLASKMAG